MADVKFLSSADMTVTEIPIVHPKDQAMAFRAYRHPPGGNMENLPPSCSMIVAQALIMQAMALLSKDQIGEFGFTGPQIRAFFHAIGDEAAAAHESASTGMPAVLGFAVASGLFPDDYLDRIKAADAEKLEQLDALMKAAEGPAMSEVSEWLKTYLRNGGRIASIVFVSQDGPAAIEDVPADVIDTARATISQFLAETGGKAPEPTEGCDCDRCRTIRALTANPTAH